MLLFVLYGQKILCRKKLENKFFSMYILGVKDFSADK